MKIVIVGGGKVGFYLAKTLLEHGHAPCLIEQDKQRCAQLANQLDLPVICGDGSSLETLEAAGTAQADALLGVTGQDENNLIVCQLAKACFQVPRTVARVNNPKNSGLMKRLGVDIPISSTDSIARLLEREVDTAAIRQLMSLNAGEASLVELQLPAGYPLAGVRLSQLQLPEDSILVSITRAGSLIIPRGNTQLQEGDKIIAICRDAVVHELSRRLRLETGEGPQP